MYILSELLNWPTDAQSFSQIIWYQIINMNLSVCGVIWRSVKFDVKTLKELISVDIFFRNFKQCEPSNILRKLEHFILDLQMSHQYLKIEELLWIRLWKLIKSYSRPLIPAVLDKYRQRMLTTQIDSIEYFRRFKNSFMTSMREIFL